VARLLPWRNVSPSTSPKKGRIALGKGYSVSIVDDAGIEIHRESVDSAEKSG
jgi:hypothetical protein